jgi:thiol-disulfide isomerase/thioredoxin
MSVRAPELAGEWVSGTPMSMQSLRGKTVLLDFFTFGCINCINTLPTLEKLQARYGNALQIIGIHSGKFAYEKEIEAVRSAIKRLDIAYPVLNDPDGYLVDQYAVKAWPTMVLINAEGSIAAQFRGEAQGEAIEEALRKLALIPVARTQRRIEAQEGLRFPEAVVCSDVSVFVADSGGHEVREYTKQGRLLRRFVPFAHPKGLALFGQTLYIADSENGTVCSIDLVSEARKVLFEGLRAPSALTADEETLTVAEAGAHLVTVFDRHSLRPLARFGNRFEALRDGEGEAAQLAQPMGIVRCDDGTLWFVDAESSALRFIEGNRVETAVGEGLFTYGDSDASPIRLQHPQGIACGRIGDGCGGGRLFVSDTYNGKIKAYDPLNGRMMTVSEGMREPTGICKDGCSLYIAETAAHRIVRFDLSEMRLYEFAL